MTFADKLFDIFFLFFGLTFGVIIRKHARIVGLKNFTKLAVMILCYGRGKEVRICYSPVLDLTSIVHLTVATSCPASKGGSGLPIITFLIQGTQTFLIFLFDKTFQSM